MMSLVCLFLSFGCIFQVQNSCLQYFILKKRRFLLILSVEFGGTAGFIRTFKRVFFFKFFERLNDMVNYGEMLNLNFKMI